MRHGHEQLCLLPGRRGVFRGRLAKARYGVIGRICAGMLLAAAAGPAATFVVVNNSDSGPGTFRQAVMDASVNPGEDQIIFSNVVGFITASNPLPSIGNTVITGPGASNLTVVTP